MKYIYLVSRRDNYGDSECVLEAWSTKEQAEDRANFYRETIADATVGVFIQEFGLDVTEDEYLNIKYGDNEYNGN